MKSILLPTPYLLPISLSLKFTSRFSTFFTIFIFTFYYILCVYIRVSLLLFCELKETAPFQRLKMIGVFCLLCCCCAARLSSAQMYGFRYSIKGSQKVRHLKAKFGFSHFPIEATPHCLCSSVFSVSDSTPVFNLHLLSSFLFLFLFIMSISMQLLKIKMYQSLISHLILKLKLI